MKSIFIALLFTAAVVLAADEFTAEEAQCIEKANEEIKAETEQYCGELRTKINSNIKEDLNEQEVGNNLLQILSKACDYIPKQLDEASKAAKDGKKADVVAVYINLRLKAKKVSDEVTAELDKLSEEQREKIQPVIDETVADLKKIRDDGKAALMKCLSEETNDD